MLSHRNHICQILICYIQTVFSKNIEENVFLQVTPLRSRPHGQKKKISEACNDRSIMYLNMCVQLVHCLLVYSGFVSELFLFVCKRFFWGRGKKKTDISLIKRSKDGIRKYSTIF